MKLIQILHGPSLSPTEVDFVLCNSSKARNNSNWKPKVSFQELVKLMTDNLLELAEREAHALQFRK
jgi:GDPmannose 4,6-dehydratase